MKIQAPTDVLNALMHAAHTHAKLEGLYNGLIPE
jgi:hypothetical protein